MVSVAYQTNGSSASGSASASVPYPTSGTFRAGDVLVLVVSTKYNNLPSTPSGWTAGTNYQKSGGSGSSTPGTSDRGTVTASIFTKVADGTETGNVSVTATSANITYCSGIFVYRPSISFSTTSLALVSGADNTAGTSWSAAMDSSLDVAPGDMIVALSSSNGSNANNASAQLVTMAGVTFNTATSRSSLGSSGFDGIRSYVSEHVVATGTATATPTYSMTLASSGTDFPAGATVLLRIREVEASQSVWVSQQEVAVATQPPGSVRLFQQEINVAYATPIIVPAVKVSATATVGSPVFTSSASVAPAVVAVTATVGSPSIPAKEEAATVAAVANVGSVTVSVDNNANVAPASVVAVAAVGTVALSVGSTLNGVTVAAAATVSGSAFTPQTPATVAATATVGVPSLSVVVPGGTVAATATVGAPAVSSPISVATVTAAATVGVTVRARLRYVGSYSDAATTGTLQPPIADGEVGDLIVVIVARKGATPTMTSSGWTEITGAAGVSTNGAALGVDTGDSTVRAFYLIATTAQGGYEQPDIGPGGSVGIAKAFRFALGSGLSPVVTGVFIDDPTGDTSFGGTSAGSLTVGAGDFVLAGGFIASDTPRFSAESVAVSGASISLLTEALDAGTTSGNDIGAVMTVHTVDSGAGSGTVTYAATADTGTGAYGPIAVIKITATLIVPVVTVAASATIGSAVVREIQVVVNTTLGGLADVVDVGDDRVGWSVDITSPLDGALTVSGGLTVYGWLYAADNHEADVQVQVSTSSTFATILATVTSAPVDPDELWSAAVSGLTAGVTYYLRARGGHTSTAAWGDWSATVTFATSSDVGDGYAYLYASDVDTSTPVPHVWWTIYNQTADTFTVVGTGFGATPSTYNAQVWAESAAGLVQLAPTTWSLVPESGGDPADREIVYRTSNALGTVRASVTIGVVGVTGVVRPARVSATATVGAVL